MLNKPVSWRGMTLLVLMALPVACAQTPSATVASNPPRG
jgi:hypothetical protein